MTSITCTTTRSNRPPPVSGIYLVSLLNDGPISVNANNPKIADRCIKVARGNCKVGKAVNLALRERNYHAVFGAENLVFERLASLDDIRSAERLVLAALGPWRVRGSTGRLNEWLSGIEPEAIRAIVAEVLARQ